jgi:hypothetical protein
VRRHVPVNGRVQVAEIKKVEMIFTYGLAKIVPPFFITQHVTGSKYAQFCNTETIQQFYNFISRRIRGPGGLDARGRLVPASAPLAVVAKQEAAAPQRPEAVPRLWKDAAGKPRSFSMYVGLFHMSSLAVCTTYVPTYKALLWHYCNLTTSISFRHCMYVPVNHLNYGGIGKPLKYKDNRM